MLSDVSVAVVIHLGFRYCLVFFCRGLGFGDLLAIDGGFAPARTR